MLHQKKKYCRTCSPIQWVLGGLCRETQECLFVPVPDETAKTSVVGILPLEIGGEDI